MIIWGKSRLIYVISLSILMSIDEKKSQKNARKIQIIRSAPGRMKP